MLRHDAVPCSGNQTVQPRHFQITIETVALRTISLLCTQIRHTSHSSNTWYALQKDHVSSLQCTTWGTRVLLTSYFQRQNSRRALQIAEYPRHWAAHMPTLKMLQGSTIQCPQVTLTVCNSHLNSAQVTWYPVMLQLYTCLSDLCNSFRLLQSWESQSKPHAADYCFALTATLHCCTWSHCQKQSAKSCRPSECLLWTQC